MKTFDIKNAIDSKTKIEWDEETKREYLPFLMNRAFSYNLHTIFHANEMNLNAAIEKKWQLDFYYHSIPKGKRYDNWAKVKSNDDIAAIMEYYYINNDRAVEYSRFLTPSQMIVIRENLERGGRK